MLGFVNQNMNVRMETNDIVVCHELPARNKETVKHVIVPDQQCGETLPDDGEKELERFTNLRQRTPRRMLGYSRRRENSDGVA